VTEKVKVVGSPYW